MITTRTEIIVVASFVYLFIYLFIFQKNRLLNLYGLLTCVILVFTSCKRKVMGILALVPLSFQESILRIPSPKRFQCVRASLLIWTAPVQEAL